MSVITRVTTALIRSLASVASSIDLGLGRRELQKKDESQSKSGQKRKDKPSNGITEQPLPKLNESDPIELSTSEIPESDASPKKPEVSFLQLIQSLKQKVSPMSRQGGAKAYQVSLRNQKKTGRVRKGTMLDTESG